jgi:transcriptional regulator GlxA family with amidase domain
MMIFFDSSQFSVVLKQISQRFHGDQKSEFNKPYMSLCEDAYVKQYLVSVLQLHHSHETFTEALRKVKLIELIIYLDDACGEKLQTALNTRHCEPSIHQLIQVMENNIDNDLKLEELAFLCNMSLATFKRSFTKTFGISPGKWLKEKRLVRSAEQIRALNKSPKEVFHEAGYVDYSSFSHAFKQTFGVSPKKYSSST